MTSRPTLPDIWNRAFDARMAEVHTAIPARVEAYNASNQTITAQPLIKRAAFDESGRVAERLPTATDVPVCFPGAGAYRLTFPIERGDIVFLLCSEASLERWKASGSEVDPAKDRRFSLSDAVAIPGLFAPANPPTEAPTDAMVLHADLIRLGGPGANDKVALLSELNDLKSAFQAHSHAGASGGPVPDTSGTYSGADKVRVE